MNQQSPPDPRAIVAGLLSDERLLRACAERDMGTVFRMLNARGASTRRIAAAVDITQGRLYDYINGKSQVEKLALFEKIADAFHIPGHLLGLARRSWEPAPAVAEHQRAERPPPDGDDLVAMDHFRNADRQAGGGRLYGAVVRHLSDRVAPRLVDVGSGPQVFAAAAALTEMAGWMAHDSGHDDRAAQHFARALPLARTSGDLALAAHVAASSSHLALQTGGRCQGRRLGPDRTRPRGAGTTNSRTDGAPEHHAGAGPGRRGAAHAGHPRAGRCPARPRRSSCR
ncbi:helix-turn-helix domain-containing protein [Streptomyces sp. Tue6028]|uniref:helix-turn-helix domain-containing protein n=1 Tax=Streptomyces sp. Tue6028 TaxID=2036037 RepID=UPI003D73DF23